MSLPSLSRFESCGVTLLGDISRPSGVTFAFTERTGGVSKPPYASLNLGSRCGDNPEAVAQNRLRALEALGAAAYASNLIESKQVHGATIVCVRSNASDALEQARTQALDGADAIVCTVPEVPVLLCFADCVPVVLVAPGGFAVVHSGWRGTLARISAKAARVLCQETGCEASQIMVYVGPHISAADYEVSFELLASFEAEFGTIAKAKGTERNLDMSACIAAALIDVGVVPSNICDTCPSTATNTDKFYSYRAEKGLCGRHGAIAYMASL